MRNFPSPTHQPALPYHTTCTNQGGQRLTGASSETCEVTRQCSLEKVLSTLFHIPKLTGNHNCLVSLWLIEDKGYSILSFSLRKHSLLCSWLLAMNGHCIVWIETLADDRANAFLFWHSTMISIIQAIMINKSCPLFFSFIYRHIKPLIVFTCTFHKCTSLALLKVHAEFIIEL